MTLPKDPIKAEETRRKMSESKKGNIPWNKKEKVIKICEVCGKEYLAHECYADIRHTCSNECRHKWQSQIMTKEKHPNYKGGGFIKICEVCGKEYSVSRTLSNKSHTCSLECDAIRRSKIYSEENSWNWKGGEVIKICEVCGKEYSVKRHLADKSFTCSHKCLGKRRSELGLFTGEKNSNWKGGTSFGKYCPKFTTRRKNAVRNFFGGYCIVTGEHQHDHKIKHSVHHIDHDREQGCNGKPFNLVPMLKSENSKEINNKEEYKAYINKTLREGFKWGIWNEEEYIEKVMYAE
jgi:hypothetical protein